MIGMYDKESEENLKEKYVHEFDSAVKDYNDWLQASGSKTKRIKEFFISMAKGMSSISSLGPQIDVEHNHSTNKSFYYYTGFDSDSDLSTEQKDTILLASDWKRVDLTLDEIISGEKIDSVLTPAVAKKGKEFVEQMYNSCKENYVKEAIRRNQF